MSRLNLFLWRSWCCCQTLPPLNVEVTQVPVDLATLDPEGGSILGPVAVSILGRAAGFIAGRVEDSIAVREAACIRDREGVSTLAPVVACIQDREEESTLGRLVVKELIGGHGVHVLPASKDENGLNKTVPNEAGRLR